MAAEVYHYSSGSDDYQQVPSASSNVVAFKQQRYTKNTSPSHNIVFADKGAPHNTSRISAGPQRQDDRLLVLFDLNGVLVHHVAKPNRNGGPMIHKHSTRPGLLSLLSLYETCRLGVYSSATARTITLAFQQLYEGLQHELNAIKDPKERRKYPLEIPTDLFSIVLCRDHCILAKHIGLSRPDGKDWDTVKPLKRYFKDLTRVVLIDDSPHKAFPQEHGNMLVMPAWDGPDHPDGVDDTSLLTLVEELVKIAANDSSTSTERRDDVRKHAQRISLLLGVGIDNQPVTTTQGNIPTPLSRYPRQQQPHYEGYYYSNAHGRYSSGVNSNSREENYYYRGDSSTGQRRGGYHSNQGQYRGGSWRGRSRSSGHASGSRWREEQPMRTREDKDDETQQVDSARVNKGLAALKL